MTTVDDARHYPFDIFVSYASEDRPSIVPLVRALEHIGLRVWWDQGEVTLGDRLSHQIDKGLARSRYGIVIISSSFIGKHWPESELRSLLTRATTSDQKVLLPIRLGIGHAAFAKAYPLLSDIVTEELDKDIDRLLPNILRAINWTPDIQQSRAPSDAQSGLITVNPSSPPAPREPSQDSVEQRHIVFLLHGIRTQGEWMTRVSHLLESQQEVDAVRQITYGFFDTVRFWMPLSLFRKRPTKRVMDLILYEITQDPNVRLSVIAHSFGAYIVGTILEVNPAIRIHRLLLCGSILPNDFAWDKLRDSQLSISSDGNWSVVNDCGTRDIWPALAQFVTLGYGSSGRFGFGHPRVRDRFFDILHSGYFEEEAVRTYWLPFITRGEIVPGLSDRPRTPWWLSVLTVTKLPYVILVVVAVFLTLQNITNWIPCLPTESNVKCGIEYLLGGNIPGPVKLEAASGDRFVRLSWQQFEEDIKPAVGLQYRVRKTGEPHWPAEWSDITVKDVDTTYWDVRGLEVGSTYEFQMRGVSRRGGGSHSNAAVSKMLALPGAPALVAEEADKQVILRWTTGANTDDDGINWMYRWKPAMERDWTEWFEVKTQAAETAHTVDNLENGANFEFQLRGTNELGAGTPSKIVVARPRGVPYAPALVAGAGSAAVLLEWIPGSENGSAVSRWQFRTKDLEDLGWGMWRDVPNGISSHEFMVGGLQNGRKYLFQLRGVNEAGYGEFSQAVQAQPRGVPSEPSLLASGRQGSVLLEWEPGSDNGATVTLWQYRVSEERLGWHPWEDMSEVSTDSSFVVNELVNGTRYGFQIRAVSEIGYGEHSNVVEVQPRDVPDAPVLSASGGLGEVTLRWKSGNDNGSPVLRWQYRFYGGFSLQWSDWYNIPWQLEGGQYVVKRLVPDRGYRFQLRAVNEIGEGKESEVATAITSQTGKVDLKDVEEFRKGLSERLGLDSPNHCVVIGGEIKCWEIVP